MYLRECQRLEAPYAVLCPCFSTMESKCSGIVFSSSGGYRGIRVALGKAETLQAYNRRPFRMRGGQQRTNQGPLDFAPDSWPRCEQVEPAGVLYPCHFDSGALFLQKNDDAMRIIAIRPSTMICNENTSSQSNAGNKKDFRGYSLTSKSVDLVRASMARLES